MCITDNNIYMK